MYVIFIIYLNYKEIFYSAGYESINKNLMFVFWSISILHFFILHDFSRIKRFQQIYLDVVGELNIWKIYSEGEAKYSKHMMTK